jgi:hypothetical protein
MNAEMLTAVFLLIAVACVITGVALLAGAGWAFVAAGASALLLAGLIQAGRPHGP